MRNGTLIVGQSGGATAVTNATLAGVIRQAQQFRYARILGMRHGLRGLLDDDLLDLTSLSAEKLDLLARTPSAAIGTSRLKLSDVEVEASADLLRKRDCRDVILIGGNDSADTAQRLHAVEPDIRVVLAPKTVDNDLPGTDHCPGYASAATFFATLVRNATFDTLSAPDLYPVKLIDAMGRDAGWLTAAASLGFHEDEADLQPLLVLPERPPENVETLLAQIEERYRQRGWLVCVLPETMRDAQGGHLSGDAPTYVDPFGHPYQLPPAVALTAAISARLGIQARFERPGSAVRMWQGSDVDRQEAARAGEEAVIRLHQGESGVMIAIGREPGNVYSATFTTCDLRLVANQHRVLDDAFIGKDGQSTTAAFRAWAAPLLNDDVFPAYLRLPRSMS